MRRSLSERLSASKALLGLLQTHPNPALAEMAGMCGFDFVILDGEHGLFSERDFLAGFQALAAGEVAALVRLAGHDLQAVGRYMDMGADAIVVPNVATVEQAQDLARAMAYPPAGTRGAGAGAHRATRYGLDGDTHLKALRDRVLLLPIIESVLGAEHAEGIIAVEGVDGVIIGPADLSADLGAPGEYSHPDYVRAFERIERAALKHGKLLGAPPHGVYLTQTLGARGHRLIILEADMPLICAAMSQQVREARLALGVMEIE